MKTIRQGEVYWHDFGPAAGSEPALRHPCVVIQSDAFNRSGISTTVVCLITSNVGRANAPGNVAIRKGEGSLAKPSVANVSQIATVDKSALTERIGKLPEILVDEIVEGVGRVLRRP